MPAGADTVTFSLVDFPFDFLSDFFSFPFFDFVFGFSSTECSAAGAGSSTFVSSAGASGGVDSANGGSSD